MEQDEQLAKVIPINQPLIDAMSRVLKALADRPWQGPKEFNAIFIDRKGFTKMASVPNPPPPIWEFAVFPKTLSVSWVERDGPPGPCRMERVAFEFYRRIGDTVEYREK